jgi:hypothetical protein
MKKTTKKTTKSTTRVLALFGLIATLAPLSVFAQSTQHFTIPFNFTVGSKTLDAGEYRVSEVTPHVLLIQSGDYRASIIVQTVSEGPEATPNLATMTFNRYGGRYFLSRVANPSRGWGLYTSPSEKELLAHRDSSKPLSVVASLRK